MSRWCNETGVIRVRIQRTATEDDQSNIRARGVGQCHAVRQDKKIRTGSDFKRSAVSQSQQRSCVTRYEGFKGARLERIGFTRRLKLAQQIPGPTKTRVGSQSNTAAANELAHLRSPAEKARIGGWTPDETCRCVLETRPLSGTQGDAMHNECVSSQATKGVESIELTRRFLVHAFSDMNDPWPVWRRAQIGIAYLLIAIDLQGMRPAIVGEDTRREPLAHQKRIKRVVMRDGGDSAEQILYPAD